MFCYFCKKEFVLAPQDKLSFRESCFHCGRDLHVCKNCNFYDTSAYNDCRESSADRVVDKEKANFCEFFMAKTNGLAGVVKLDPQAEAKKKLDDLFKK